MQKKQVDLLTSPKYYLALVAVFRDDVRFLKEWIEFYKLMGVEKFYLYNHLSKDNYLEVLTPYINENFIQLENITYNPTTSQEFYKHVQNKVYFKTSMEVKKDVEWLIFVDTDEFLYPLKEDNLTIALKNYDKEACLSVHWISFGSSDIQRIADDELMIEKLVMREKWNHTWVKSIAKPRYIESINTAHQPSLAKGYVAVNENFEPFKGSYHSPATSNIFAVNHYRFRDLDFFYETKLQRLYYTSNLNETEKEKSREAAILHNKKASQVFSNSILKFVPALKQQIFKKNNISSISEEIVIDNEFTTCSIQNEQCYSNLIGELN
jgi:hypothetical protein